MVVDEEHPDPVRAGAGVMLSGRAAVWGHVVLLPPAAHRHRVTLRPGGVSGNRSPAVHRCAGGCAEAVSPRSTPPRESRGGVGLCPSPAAGSRLIFASASAQHEGATIMYVGVIPTIK